MLRTTYYVVTTMLLFGVCQTPPTYQSVIKNRSAVVVADGPAPAPPPLPLAVPLSQIQMADGPAPAPPPLPLAVPVSWVAPVQA